MKQQRGFKAPFLMRAGWNLKGSESSRSFSPLLPPCFLRENLLQIAEECWCEACFLFHFGMVR